MCERAGVNVKMETYRFLRPATPLGAWAFNKMALARGEKPIPDDKPLVRNRNASQDIITEVPEAGGLQKQLLLTPLEGQREIIDLLRQINNRIIGGNNQGTIILHNANDDANNNIDVNENHVNEVHELGNAGDETNGSKTSGENEIRNEVDVVGNIEFSLDKNLSDR